MEEYDAYYLRGMMPLPPQQGDGAGMGTKKHGMVLFLLALPLVILIGIALVWVGTQINSVVVDYGMFWGCLVPIILIVSYVAFLKALGMD